MKREPVFLKPTYKYKGEVKEHPIERLEFIDVPKNDLERLRLSTERLKQYLRKAFSGIIRQ